MLVQVRIGSLRSQVAVADRTNWPAYLWAWIELGIGTLPWCLLSGLFMFVCGIFWRIESSHIDDIVGPRGGGVLGRRGFGGLGEELVHQLEAECFHTHIPNPVIGLCEILEIGHSNPQQPDAQRELFPDKIDGKLG